MILQRLEMPLWRYSAGNVITDTNDYFPTVRDVIVWLVIFAVIAYLIIKIITSVSPFMLAFYDLLRDWKGMDAENGRPKVPGVVERISTLETITANNTKMLDTIDKRTKEIEQLLCKGINNERDK